MIWKRWPEGLSGKTVRCSNAITGELLEVTAGAVLVRGKDGQEAAVNLDFILKILEVPEKKKKR